MRTGDLHETSEEAQWIQWKANGTQMEIQWEDEIEQKLRNRIETQEPNRKSNRTEQRDTQTEQKHTNLIENSRTEQKIQQNRILFETEMLRVT